MILKLEDLKLADCENSFLLIDRASKEEVLTLARQYVLKHKDFSDWVLVSPDDPAVAVDPSQNKAIILFPKDLPCSKKHIENYISNFDQVILIDCLPTFAEVEMRVFYLGYFQKLQEVDHARNSLGLSSDKKLILKNLKGPGFKTFLEAVERRIDCGECFFLVASEGTTRACNKGAFYLYPKQTGKIKIAEELIDAGDMVYVAVGRGSKVDLMNQVQSFMASNTYPWVRASHILATDSANNYQAS